MPKNTQASVDQQWEEEFERWTPRRVKQLIAIIIALCVILPLVGWGFHVATSGVEGRGDQIVKNYEEVNRTGKQEMFETLYADIHAYQAQIGNAAKDVSTNTDASDTARLKMVLTGLKNQCTNTVEQYNAETHKVTSSDWKDPRLPYKIDPSEFCS